MICFVENNNQPLFAGSVLGETVMGRKQLTVKLLLSAAFSPQLQALQ
jgi:hypothetical protein